MLTESLTTEPQAAPDHTPTIPPAPPSASEAQIPQKPLTPPDELEPTTRAAEPAVVPSPDIPFPLDSPSFPTEFAGLEPLSRPLSTAARLKELQQARKRQTRIGLAIGGLILVVGGGIAMFLTRTSGTGSKGTPAGIVGTNPDGSASNARDETNADPGQTDYAGMGAPTHGKPIELRYVPFGTQVAIHLRPAELWTTQSRGEELRRCVPPLANLIERTLESLFQLKPEDVEELLICLIPGQRGNPPDIAAVAQTRVDQDREARIAQFGPRLDGFEPPVYATGETAYLIPDVKTLVAGPRAQADEMVKAIETSHPAELLDPLLPQTDRQRHLTIVFDPLTLKLHDAWFAENLRPFVKNSLDWFPESINAVSWSMHFTDELFYSEVLLHVKNQQLKSVERDVGERVTRLAGELVPWFEQMNPTEQGKRMVIGRVPAMIEVCSMATTITRGPHHLRLVTPLPDRAAPNLFLGTLLAWDESTRTDFTAARRSTTESQDGSISIAERLSQAIDVDFRAAPMNEAFAFISGEIKTPIEIDGDALKAGGFTKNIKQSFRMDATRAQDVIARIFSESKSIESNPEKCLVLVIDEANQKILITTQAAADRRQLKSFRLV